jgi:hypothetical protein
MYAYDTGKTEAVHMPLLSVAVSADIHATIETVALCSDAEGRVSFNILRGGVISVIEMMTRKVRGRKRPAC